ncbi:Uncharacterised protein [Bordetella pertussis]|nr:Uncharacterised protein [Bordetella pertussis]
MRTDCRCSAISGAGILHPYSDSTASVMSTAASESTRPEEIRAVSGVTFLRMIDSTMSAIRVCSSCSVCMAGQCAGCLVRHIHPAPRVSSATILSGF